MREPDLELDDDSNSERGRLVARANGFGNGGGGGGKRAYVRSLASDEEWTSQPSHTKGLTHAVE